MMDIVVMMSYLAVGFVWGYFTGALIESRDMDEPPKDDMEDEEPAIYHQAIREVAELEKLYRKE